MKIFVLIHSTHCRVVLQVIRALDLEVEVGLKQYSREKLKFTVSLSLSLSQTGPCSRFIQKRANQR